MSNVPSITVGHLKEIWKQHNVSDDDTIAFHFTKVEEHYGEDYKECREIEFDRLYKREFGILMDFVPAELEEDEEDEDYEPSDDDMMSAFGTKWHDGL